MSPDSTALLVSLISLIITLALGFLGVVYQLRSGQKSLRDEMQADREERRAEHKERRTEHKETMALLQKNSEERRAEHKETMALLHNMDKNMGIIADRTLRESYPQPRKARQ